jgi:hypothetical protein
MRISNFGRDISDSYAYFYLLNQLDARCAMTMIQEPNPHYRAFYMLQNATLLLPSNLLPSPDGVVSVCAARHNLTTQRVMHTGCREGQSDIRRQPVLPQSRPANARHSRGRSATSCSAATDRAGAELQNQTGSRGGAPSAAMGARGAAEYATVRSVVQPTTCTDLT